MTIALSENLKKLRLLRDLTQEDVAQFLGVTSQAVSKWERNEGYPDITILPVIANYFEVTVDDLIGNDVLSKQQKVERYRERYFEFNKNSQMDEAVETAKKAYSEFPYEWGIIEIYVLGLTRGFSEIPEGEKMAELRRLCELIIEKCTDPIIRKRAVYSMTFAEDDDRVEYWFSQAPDNRDYLESERRADRYLDRGQWELYYPQKQKNMMDAVGDLTRGMGCYYENCDVKWRIESRRRRIEFMNLMFRDTDRILMSGKIGGELIELAMAYDEAGETENAVNALKEALELHEEHERYGEKLGVLRSAKVNLKDPMWNKLQYPAFPMEFSSRLCIYERFAQKPEYSKNEEFQKLIERARAKVEKPDEE